MDRLLVEDVARAIGNCVCCVSPNAPPSTQVSVKGESNGWIKAAEAAINAHNRYKDSSHG